MNIESILDFWFGTHPDDAVVAKEQAKLWWSKNGETDDEMRKRFEDAVRSAATGQLNEWLVTARGRSDLAGVGALVREVMRMRWMSAQSQVPIAADA